MTLAPLGVVVVTYNAADVILDCLETLLGAAAADGAALRVVVVDNASTDGTPAVIRDWAAGRVPYVAPDDLPFAHLPVAKPLPLGSAAIPGGARCEVAPLTLIETGSNGGFAAGVNIGLAHLASDPGIERFWVLNPDSAVPAGTPAAFATRDPGPFSLMGGRVIYLDAPDKIQIDGGLLDRRTGVTHNSNQFCPPDVPPPDPAALDFITGASMVASRAFYEAVGPMSEDYFLYYEEVDWALRRGDLPLAYCPGGIVYHRAGSAIGSQAVNRPASPFSLYFIHRARMRFVRRFFPASLPLAFAFSLAKAGQLALKGYRREAGTLLLASLNRPPPAHVRIMLSDDAARRAIPEHIGKS
ncbi:glycosyltransferase family 2 protein [Puniceibacterium sediminis]|uniref:Glycosyltransferase 2-like domain-containing protein n=1 Tax=Puniceibacterium sediminis TaxID=1608407 RepID=A0A238YLD1_9RHOB|nr:glycosyltransferase family 2 protein [Puniceibacterium sediminis]SNR71937.1 hypothetical protein SAMN06265370_11819 [Puniceibacterium sediminis]